MSEASKLLRLCEGSNDLIIVDVQPQYLLYIGFDIQELMQYANTKQRVLAFYVGTKTVGQDTEDDVRWSMHEHGLEEDTNIEFVDKGYSFLRPWMDNGVSHDEIAKYAGLMLEAGINDSRQFPDWDEITSEIGTDEPLFIPQEIDGGTLRSFDGAEICGGGRHECLAEVQILMDAMGLSYRTIERFVY